MAKLTITTLKKHLLAKSQPELVEEIIHLYKQSALVKDYYDASSFGNDQDVLDKYKNIIKKEFAGTCPRLRKAVIRKAIADYRKVSSTQKNIVDIMLYYVEMAIDCTHEIGGVEDHFDVSVEGTFDKAVALLIKHNLKDHFKPRLEQIVAQAKRTWFEENIEYTYEQHIIN